MSGPAAARPAICLNMIVRNEAHIVGDALDSVTPYISSWVIVDTGSDDGTQDVIRDQMATLGIPGELHQRPWRDFGHNRSEALSLAQGHGEYIWVMDADDVVVGAPDFTGLDADIYFMRLREGSVNYWRPQLFRDGLSVHYAGVVHEACRCDDPHTEARLEGDYRIESRRLGARSQDAQKYARDRDLLLAEVERKPHDARSVFYLAQSYFDLGDFTNARNWYARRVEMGGWAEEVYYSMVRVAESMEKLDESWSEVADAYLRAFEFRPTRAEPLHALARRYRVDQRYQLGYVFAARAAQIPIPEEDRLFVCADIYAWRAVDEQAVCGFWVGKHAEAFALCRSLLARPDIPDHERQRIAGNRDFSVAAMIDAATPYPEKIVGSLVAGGRDDEVTVSLIAGPNLAHTEQSLNSFLHCCTDVSRVGRFVLFDASLSDQDREILCERYGFLEFRNVEPGAQLAQLRAHVHGKFWLHLGQGWRFFAPENFITRLTAVLAAEPDVFQVGINFADAAQPTGTTAAEQTVRRAPDAGRYVIADAVASGPAMFDTTRLDRAAGLQTATLDEVLCTAAAYQVQQEATLDAPASRPSSQPVLKNPEPTALRDLLAPSRLTHVVDVGANPIDGQPPYTDMLADGLCHVTGFEPQGDALLELQQNCGPNERYLPYAVGDGGAHTLNICRAPGMTSLLTPDPVNLKLFDFLRPLGDVIGHVPLQTHRLDDIDEIQHLDFLKMDIQGSELAVFQGGRSKLAECVAIQTEVSFVTLYENQPTLGDVDLELRSQGFMPHCFAAVKNWAIAPLVVDGDPRRGLNQLLEADIVYVRDVASADGMTDEQLKHLASIAHHCYGSFDLSLRCVAMLEDRRAIKPGSRQRYRELLAAKVLGRFS